MKQMKEVTRYQCKHCKKDFRTPNKHYCKFNPELKNCFTCKHSKGWLDGEETNGYYYREPNYPDCIADGLSIRDWNIELIKELNYNMQCEKWEQGKYDWSKESDIDVW